MKYIRYLNSITFFMKLNYLKVHHLGYYSYMIARISPQPSPNSIHLAHLLKFSDCIDQSAANCGICVQIAKMIDLYTYRQRIGGV